MIRIIALALLTSLLISCGGGGSSGGTADDRVTDENHAPIAVAGMDLSATTDTVLTLDGSDSSDADGDPLSYHWNLASFPLGSTATLFGVNNSAPTFTPDIDGEYEIQLTVNDGSVNSSPSIVLITSSTLNSKPTANAGTDQKVITNNTVNLDGSGSSDAEDDSLTYQWTLVSSPLGSTATLLDANSITATFTPDIDGDYEIQLTVNDGSINSSPSNVFITSTTLNSRPIANAGTDQNVITNNAVNLDGSGSSDAEGDSLSYQWVLASSPLGSTTTLFDANSIAATFTPDIDGDYEIQLTVNDGSINSSPNNVFITSTTLNSRPIANAGTDQNVNTNNEASLDGSGSSDPDLDILSYQWTFISSPIGSLTTLTNAATETPSFTPDIDGDYVIQLIVNDGETNSDAVTVTITSVTRDTVAPNLISVTGDVRIVQGESGVLTFSFDEPIANIPNTAGGNGVTIDYVDVTGNKVTISYTGPNNGETTIVVSSAQDDAGNEASDASQDLTISPFADIPFVAWAGKDDTEITFPAQADGSLFIRSTEGNCDLTDYISCANGIADTSTGHTMIDTAFNFNQPAYYWLSKDGYTSKRTDMSVERFSGRYDHQVVVFDNKLWIIGGYDKNNTNDVWSSSNGITWTQVTDNADFAARREHQVAVFDNKLWVIGGYIGGTGINRTNDVWSSSDGISWTQVNANASFSARLGHQVAVFDNKLWVIGGRDDDSRTNDVWSSIDGINWTQVTANAAFSGRTYHQVTVFENKLWVIGGLDDYKANNDSWSSSDGITWTQVTANAAFSARYDHQTTTFDNKLWVIGGTPDEASNNKTNDVWSSSDGVTWTQTTTNAAFRPRKNHQIVVFHNKLLVIGGGDNGSGTDDIWSSSEGVTWTQITSNAAFSARSLHQVAIFDGKLWVIGGGDGSKTNDVWSSADGITWDQATANAEFSARYDHQVAVFDNKLWVIGGFDGNKTNDVWSSPDGTTWTQATANAAFSGRYEHHVEVFDNKLWVLGGRDDGRPRDAWSSEDGVTWTLVSDTVPVSAYYDEQVVVFNNKFWVIDGNRETVWSSDDAITWQPIYDPGFSSRFAHHVTVFDNKLWLIGGLDYSTWRNTNDVWSSDDGITWIQVTSNAPFSGRSYHQTAAFNNKLWVIGGYDGGKTNDVWSSPDGDSWRKGFYGKVRF